MNCQVNITRLTGTLFSNITKQTLTFTDSISPFLFFIFSVSTLHDFFCICFICFAFFFFRVSCKTFCFKCKFCFLYSCFSCGCVDENSYFCLQFYMKKNRIDLYNKLCLVSYILCY